jgi:phosphoglycerate dehydrogenase-like enzyme
VSTGEVETVVVALLPEPDGLARLRGVAARHGCTLEVIEPLPEGLSLSEELVVSSTALLTDYNLPANYRAMERLRWIQLACAGYEHLSGLPLRSMGVRVTNASGANDPPMAQWCMLMILALERDLRSMLDLQRAGRYVREARFQSDVTGKRVGIVGYGNVGREVARLCKALGMEVWALARRPVGPRHDRYRVRGTGDPEGALPDRTLLADELDELLAAADYVVVAAALTPETQGLLGERELRLMKPTAVLLNVARAGLLDEDALRRALDEGLIAGAALDVHYREPMAPDDPTWTLPNAIVTPHISGSGESPFYLSRIWEIATENLRLHLEGKPLLNEISWEELGAT